MQPFVIEQPVTDFVVFDANGPRGSRDTDVTRYYRWIHISEELPPNGQSLLIWLPGKEPTETAHGWLPDVAWVEEDYRDVGEPGTDFEWWMMVDPPPGEEEG